MADAKRRRLEVFSAPTIPAPESGVEFNINRAARLRREIQSTYGTKPPGFLWDTTKIWDLIHPSLTPSHGSGKQFDFVGRARARALYDKIAAVEPGDLLVVLGAKGSGKSTVMSAIAGAMLAENKRVVYICGSRYVESPVLVLQLALMVATGSCDAGLSSTDRMDELASWCAKAREPLVFIIDEWEEVEKASVAVKEYLTSVVYIEDVSVRVVSGRSRNRHLMSDDDQPMPSFEFDGPYTPDELSTWISQCQLPPSKLQHLDVMTGGMPGLLKFFSDANGDVRNFLTVIEGPYTGKLLKLVQKQKNRSQLAGFLNLLLTGKNDARVEGVNFTCFYRDGRMMLHFLSPHLRARAEAFIMDQQTTIDAGLQLEDMASWAALVARDYNVVAMRNPARAGCNVGSLVIAVMRYLERVWNCLPFNHFRSYETGCEAGVLGSLTDEQLGQGVLVAPVSFNEPYVDATYVRLEEEKLTVKAIQISASSWEKKKRQKSQRFWQERVLPKWLAGGWEVFHQFVYVLPSRVKEQVVLEAVVGRLSSYLGDAQGSTEDCEEVDEGEIVYTADVSLEKVKDVEVELKTFGDIHASLSRLDRLLKPVELHRKVVEKPNLVFCSGSVVKEESGAVRCCRNRCRTDAESYVCHAHREKDISEYIF